MSANFSNYIAPLLSRQKQYAYRESDFIVDEQRCYENQNERLHDPEGIQ